MDETKTPAPVDGNILPVLNMNPVTDSTPGNDLATLRQLCALGIQNAGFNSPADTPYKLVMERVDGTAYGAIFLAEVSDENQPDILLYCVIPDRFNQFPQVFLTQFDEELSVVYPDDYPAEWVKLAGLLGT